MTPGGGQRLDRPGLIEGESTLPAQPAVDPTCFESWSVIKAVRNDEAPAK